MIYVNIANKIESKQLKKYLKSIGCRWGVSGTINLDYNSYKVYGDQTVYKISSDKSVIIKNKKGIKDDIYTQNGFMKAAYFNKLDSIIHCPTIEDNEKFIKIVNNKLDKKYEYIPFRKKVKGLMCYKVLNNKLTSASWKYYYKHRYNIVNFKILEIVANLNNINVEDYI